MINLSRTSRIRLGLISSIILTGLLVLTACQPEASANQATSTSAAVTDTVATTSMSTDTAMATTPTTSSTMSTTDTVAATMATTDTPAATSAMMTDTPAATSAMTDTPAATSMATATPAAGGMTPTVSGTMMSTTTINVKADATLGNILVDANGMTLYQFKKDTAGVSACTGGCLTLWPALAAANGAAPTAGTGVTGKLGVITRPDGTTQVTYNSLPLYYYASDKAAGDTKGQGVGNLWYVVAP